MTLFKKLILTFFFFLPQFIYSQLEQVNWFFGNGAGLNFSTSIPTIVNGGQINTREGVCSISDKNSGQLLFYSEGTSVWNKNHNVMPNGTGLLGDFSSTQSSIAIPNPNSSDKFFLFTTALFLGMHYSEIDMTLNAGLGDVIPSTKNTMLLPSNQSSEKLIAVKHCNKKDYWVITHALNSNAYYVYLVNSSGVQAPLIFNIGYSIGGPLFWEGVGYLKLSIDGSRIANAVGPDILGIPSIVELLNFNNKTGAISGPVVQLNNLDFPYGVEFSPNGKFLYVSETLGKKIHQYDLSSTDINLSKTTLSVSANLSYGTLQLGPNGKIYVSAENGYDIGYKFLGVINQPNLQGLACNFIPDAIDLSPGLTKIGLPTFPADFLLKDSAIIDFAGSCTSMSRTFSFSGVSNIDSVKWDFGDGSPLSSFISPTHTYTSANTFTVKLIAYKSCNVNDTALKTISITLLTLDAGPDTVICNGQPVLLQSSSSGAIQYLWSPSNYLNNGTIQNPIATLPPGITVFYVTATSLQGCTKTDSVKITVRPPPLFTVNPNLSICKFDTARLFARGGDTYLWQPAAGINSTIPDPFVVPNTTSIYTVTITDTLCNVSQDLSTTVTILPLPDVRANKLNDIDCNFGIAQLSASGALQYSWSSAATLSNASVSSPTARPTVTTQYYVSGTDVKGCTNSDSIIVKVDFSTKGNFLLPNAFTPNNDGVNDCFGIKYWGSITELDFKIYSRWGQLIFHSTDPNKCWDGNVRGIKQDPGVFVYWIKAKSTCQNEIFRKGIVVLIR